jgi:hypothetical protein
MKVKYKGEGLERYVTKDVPWALDVSFDKNVHLAEVVCLWVGHVVDKVISNLLEETLVGMTY